MTDLMWMGVIFAGVFVGAFGLLSWANVQREKVRKRLELQGGVLGVGDSNPEMVLGGLTSPLAEMAPLGGEKKEQIQSELLQAGYYRSTALQEFAAVRAVLVLLPLFLAGLFALLVVRERVPQVILAGMAIAALGYSLPRVWINYQAAVRKRQIEKGLPVAVDLLALGLLAGQNVLNSLRRVSTEMKNAFPVLAQELEIVRRQAELNTLPHALEQFSDRVQVAEVRNLVIILTQSQKHGTDVASGLMEFANNFRTSLRQRADKRANQASFWLIFPSIFCLWLPAAVVLMAPILMEFKAKSDSGKEAARDNIEQRRRILNRNAPQQAAPSAEPTQ
jgi:tight adherence protein C